MRYHYRLLNVFAEHTFGGNPLCVFEDGSGLSDADMLAITRQFNLSETTFLFPSEQADALMRIFTPGHEMRFAGHPSLGTAYVLRSLRSGGDTLSLECKAGIVPLQAQGDVWTLQAPVQTIPAPRPEPQAAQLARLLGLQEDDLAALPVWMDTGSEQLLIALRSVDALRRARAAPDMSQNWPRNNIQRQVAYLFADNGVGQDGVAQMEARYLFVQPGGGVGEDPGTGSACANLGALLLAQGHSLPLQKNIVQGLALQRACHLRLQVNQAGQIFVGGRVLELGRGYLDLP